MPHPAIHSSVMTPVRFDHIAIGVPRIAEVPAFLEGTLGGVARYGRSTGGAFIWTVWRFEGGGRIEILEPFGKDGFLHRFLAQRGPGIHHVTFKVPSLDEICERARGHGYTPVGRDESDPSWKEAFLHPKQALGIVVQLAESRSAPPPDPPPSIPPGLPDPPPPVSIVGLRLRAHSRDRAVAQWREVFQGEVGKTPEDGLVFRWSGSGL